jgi:CDP-glucose 4,6-dehydratase
MRYLITGHTGFKGSWMALWLHERGHSVHGLALAPEASSLYVAASVDRVMDSSVVCDVRDAGSVLDAISAARPDVVLHLAAQPLVRESYRDPRGTFETNVAGTFNVLQAVAASDTIQAQVIVTTDKVYRNTGKPSGYVEQDPLGGNDPYSASKAMADILTTSWARSFDGPPTAIVRAGNVIGGGDTSRDRLMPDIIEACQAGTTLHLRNPSSTRPWQHVLDCLHGYLMLADHLMKDESGSTDRGAWNFGPDPVNCVPVSDIATLAMRLWGSSSQWTTTSTDLLHEAAELRLDSTKARSALGWLDLLTLEEAVAWTVDWHQSIQSGADPQEITLKQIRAFELR